MSQLLTKPLLRGHFHQAAFFVALGACAMLVVKGFEVKALLSVTIYSLSLIGLFGISALYHRPMWPAHIRVWMRRLDHAAIFLLIAGTSTPICLLGLRSSSGDRILILIWIVAFIGMLQSLFFVNIPKWASSFIYLIAGWVALPFYADIKDALSFSNSILILSGGAAYTMGALVYAMKRPNPAPRVFGYHEIFHLWVVVGATLHFIAVSRLLDSIREH